MPLGLLASGMDSSSESFPLVEGEVSVSQDSDSENLHSGMFLECLEDFFLWVLSTLVLACLRLTLGLGLSVGLDWGLALGLVSNWESWEGLGLLELGGPPS